MRKLVFIILIFNTTILRAQDFEWVASQNGGGGDHGYGVANDVDGNIITVGEFGGTADFDPGATTFNLTSNGSSDIYIQKLDAQGNFLWAKSIGAAGAADKVRHVATDTSNNVYVCGRFFSTVDFGDKLMLYPNPTNGNFSIDLGGKLW